MMGGSADETLISAATGAVTMIDNNTAKKRTEQLNQAIMPYLTQTLLANTMVAVNRRVEAMFATSCWRQAFS